MKRALRVSAVIISVAWAATTMTAIGCATATGEISGGEGRFDATAPLTCSGDAGPLLSSGHTWAELYADYFGNLDRVGCAGNGSCHGDAAQTGALNSNFVCPVGDATSCYKSITSGAASLVFSGDPATSPLTTQVLRHADGSVGNMPKNPPCAFSATDLQRINDWIQAGASDDSPTDAGGSSKLDAGDASD
ncbi:MAG: hypothetical protein ABI183_06775 [Polyangiaceae bacterium]